MEDYGRERFRRGDLFSELRFEAGRDPGWELPDFDLPTVSGGRARKADFTGTRPLLVTCASLTDPMAASAAPVLKRLHARYRDSAGFLTVYVREAHPGERIPQPRTMDQKLRHARLLRARDGLPWQVAVDDLDGTFHRALGGNSSAAYVMDPLGKVAFRTLWSNDERVLDAALRAVVEGRPDHPFERQRRVAPLLRGLGRVDDVVRAAGPAAMEDLRRETPLLYAAAEAAWVWRTLTPAGRLVLLASAGAAFGAVLGGWRLARRRWATRGA